MCFWIDKRKQRALKEKQSKNTIVYKVVVKTTIPFFWIGIFYDFEYANGGVYKLKARSKTYENGHTRCGFYVYTTLEEAKSHKLSVYEIVIMLRVDPRDLLFVDTLGRQATYRKVTVLGKVGR